MSCPCCGYCSACGRRNAQPYYPYYQVGTGGMAQGHAGTGSAGQWNSGLGVLQDQNQQQEQRCNHEVEKKNGAL